MVNENAQALDELALSLVGLVAATGDLEKAQTVFDETVRHNPDLLGAMFFVAAVRHGAAAYRKLAEATDRDVHDLIDEAEENLTFDQIAFNFEDEN